MGLDDFQKTSLFFGQKYSLSIRRVNFRYQRNSANNINIGLCLFVRNYVDNYLGTKILKNMFLTPLQLFVWESLLTNIKD